MSSFLKVTRSTETPVVAPPVPVLPVSSSLNTLAAQPEGDVSEHADSDMLTADFYKRWNSVFQLLAVCQFLIPQNEAVATETNAFWTKDIVEHNSRRDIFARRFERIPGAIHSIAVRNHEIIATTGKASIGSFATALGVATDDPMNLETSTFQSWIAGMLDSTWRWVREWIADLIMITNPHDLESRDMKCRSGVCFVKMGRSDLSDVMQLGHECFGHR